ncbi:MAG: 2'-5' RNA ligase family protein [Promethearchaeota archaeon]
MNKSYNSAVVIIPPIEKWAPIQKIRKLYDRQINRWMPHITLLYPFTPENEYSKLERIFSEICEPIKQFKISLRKFDYFGHGRQRFTLWLDPEPIESIITLQAKILNIVPDCNDVNKFKKGFRPHLSVGQIMGKDKLNKLINKLQKNWEEITFSLNTIYFISREDNKASKFKISKQMKLNG